MQVLNRGQKLYILTMSTYLAVTIPIDLLSFGYYVYSIVFVFSILVLLLFKKIRAYTIAYKGFIILSLAWFCIRYFSNIINIDIPLVNNNDDEFLFYTVGFIGGAGYYLMARYIINDKEKEFKENGAILS